MTLTVLVDNNTFIDQYYLAQPALCIHIEDEGTNLLLDTGYSDIYLQNAQKMGIDLTQVQKIVFSHGHNDHTGGLAHWNLANSPEIIAHPDTFVARSCGGEEIGSPLSREDVEELFKITFSKQPLQVSSHLVFLGEIPQYTTFEYRQQLGRSRHNRLRQPDYVMDDTALAYTTPDGLYIITGCSHSGICNICEHAKKVCNNPNILGIIGGFHLFECDNQLEQTIAYFVNNQIQHIYPCHCVSFAAKARMHRQIQMHEVAVGLRIEWPG